MANRWIQPSVSRFLADSALQHLLHLLSNGFRQFTRNSVSNLPNDSRSVPCKMVIIRETLQASHFSEREVTMFVAVEQKNVFPARHAVHSGLDSLGRPIELA